MPFWGEFSTPAALRVAVTGTVVVVTEAMVAWLDLDCVDWPCVGKQDVLVFSSLEV
jgi:hypothetical protein